MKNIYLYVLAIIMTSCITKPEKTIITGAITNLDSGSVELTYNKNYINYEQAEFKTELDENNNFRFELDIEKSLNAYLIINRREFIEIYIEPGDKLHIKADSEDLKNTTIFTGNNADNSTLLGNFSVFLQDKYSQYHVYQKIRNSNPKEFIDYANEMLKTKKTKYADLSENKNLSVSFTQYMETEILFDYYEKLLNYPRNHQTLNRLDDLPELPENYYDFIGDAFQSLSDKKLKSYSFFVFITSYLENYKTDNPDRIPADKSGTEAVLHLAEKFFDGKILNYIKAYYISMEFEFGDFEQAESLYKSFLDEEPEKELIIILSESYEQMKRLLPGNPAPNFELTDIDGNLVSLEDFRGKVVYLDFWATWCSPCLSEIPHAKKLKDRFKDNDDLIFLYISVDDNPDAWTTTVVNNNIEGIHLRVHGMRNDITKSYNIRGVPTYFIIDRNGFIFNNNAKRPSSEGIDDDLKAALEKIS